MSSEPIERSLVAKLRELPFEKQREVLDFASLLGKSRSVSRKSLYGQWKDLNIAISEDDIGEARNEMWEHLPREQFFE